MITSQWTIGLGPAPTLAPLCWPMEVAFVCHFSLLLPSFEHFFCANEADHQDGFPLLKLRFWDYSRHSPWAQSLSATSSFPTVSFPLSCHFPASWLPDLVNHFYHHVPLVVPSQSRPTMTLGSLLMAFSNNGHADCSSCPWAYICVHPAWACTFVCLSVTMFATQQLMSLPCSLAQTKSTWPNSI